MSHAVTEVVHNHPEGIKGPEATQSQRLLREKTSRSMRFALLSCDYYPFDFMLDEIRPTCDFEVTCQGAVPQVQEAFMESTSFEDEIRNAISIGGDSDTIGVICGEVVGAYYGHSRRCPQSGRDVPRQASS